MKPLIRIVLFCLILISFISSSVYSQVPPSQIVGGIEKTEEEIEREKRLKERIEKEREEEEEIITEEEEAPLEGEKKIFIKKIEVRGVTLIQKSIIDSIISGYEGKELSLREIQKVCDLITDEYRKKGYVTSRAYLPPQTIKEGLLVIMVIEGNLGSLEIRGNRFFRTSLLEKKIRLKPGDTFDYKSLQNSLRFINEHPDRHVKAVLVPGKEPGTTDIVLEVTDRFPVHVGVEYDNFGSRYIKRWRFATIAEDNNLTGLDDRLYFKYQKAHGDLFDLVNLRYILPLLPTGTDLGAYFIWNRVKLAKEFKDIGVKGRAHIGGIFLTHRLINKFNINLKLNAGFDYKRIRNFLSGNLASKDEPRVVKGGFDLDATDKWGRTIFTFETDMGVTKVLGGAKEEEPSASRAGARGDFLKFVMNLYRLQPMPFSSTILWKNQFQYSGSTLFASEQFQLGGITNVRAYSPAEYSGDIGYATSFEWALPFLSYISKSFGDFKVPMSKSTFNEATRFVAFYDLGAIYNNKKLAGERKQKFISGYGFGFRFNLPEDFSVKVEFATPIGRGPSDDIDFRTYFGIAAKI